MGFFHIHNDNRLLLDLIPKMNIFLEYLTVHSEHTSLCSGFWCSLGGQVWQKLTSQWHSVIWGQKGNLYRQICNILFSLLLLAITFFSRRSLDLSCFSDLIIVLERPVSPQQTVQILAMNTKFNLYTVHLCPLICSASMCYACVQQSPASLCTSFCVLTCVLWD